MLRKTYSLRNYFFVLTTIVLCSSPLRSQGSIEIMADNDVFFCGDRLGFSIVTSDSLLSVNWTYHGAITNFYSPDSINITYPAGGTYIITVQGYLGSLNQFFSDTLIIQVYGQQGLEVGGCFEFSQTDSCYQVCAFSTNTIYLFQGAAVEITGASGYEYISNDVIEITWGPAGYGQVVIFGNCVVSQCFDIVPEPLAEFSTTPMASNDTLTVCLLEEILFTNTSSNGISYEWDFGDGHASDQPNPGHVFSEPGFYTVTLTAHSICDCSDEKQVTVEVLPTPAPTLDCINSVCEESRQRYTATTDGCSSFNWSVSPNGTVVAGGGPSDDFIEVIWHEGPEGIIGLSVSGCLSTYCSSTALFHIPVITPGGPISGDQQVCPSEITSYSAPFFPGTSYLWTAGPFATIVGDPNGNSINIQWDNASPGSASYVIVSYDNCFLECSGSDTLQIDIRPEIRINGDDQVCEGATAMISAQTYPFPFLPADVHWHIEDNMGNVVFSAPGISNTLSHLFSYPAGEYFWVAENASSAYCTELVRRKITVTSIPDPPLGILGSARICPGIVYGFSIEASGPLLTTWTITDGTNTFTYQGQSIQHVFGNTPPYLVQAVHEDIQYAACKSDAVTLVLQNADGLMIAGPDQVCFNSIDTFSTGYIDGADYGWEIIPADHGEIRRSNLNEVIVYWTQTGPAILRLNVCGNSIDKNVLVHALPEFNLTGPMAVCENETTTIQTDQPAMMHKWFDDNENIISSLNNISLNAGTYAVEVTNNMGCVQEKSFTITSYPVPVVHLSSAYETFFCNLIPAGVDLVANTDGAGYAFTWFRDDLPLAASGPVLNINDFGEYHVEVTNAYGCSTLSEKIQFINCCPPDDCSIPLAGIPGGCTFGNIDFDISITGPTCESRIYTPQHPDIIPGTTRWFIRSVSKGLLAVIDADELHFDYELPGYYHITMIAMLDGFTYTPVFCGHLQTLSDTIRAVADFGHTGVCEDDMITFEDLTTFLPDEIITGWNWNFDDPSSGVNNTSGLQDPLHVFSDPGSYMVSLAVTMASGCLTFEAMPVNIQNGPVLNPVYESIYCENEALALYLPGEFYDIEWNFNDPGSGIQNLASSDSALHTFDIPAIYNISLTASDIHGCNNLTMLSLDIQPNTLAGNISVVPSLEVCYGDTVHLSSSPGGVEWLWSNLAINEAISVTESNQYSVLVTNASHCTYMPPPVFVSILPEPVVIVKAREILGNGEYGPWQPSLHLCYGSEFEIQAFSTANNFLWLDGQTSPVLVFTNEGGNLPAPGIYTFGVTSWNLDCYSDTTFIEVEIFDLPSAPLISVTGGTGCSEQENTLSVTNVVAGMIYTWSDGQTGPVITVENAGNYFVVATDPNGCSARSNFIYIKPSADIDLLPGGCHIKCDPLTVCLPSLTGVMQYNIYHNGSLFLSGTGWPSDFVADDDGSYVFEITTFNGCTVTSDPLDLMLYPGTGSITVLTYLDTDGDGLITPADMLLPGIPVQINSSSGISGNTNTNADAYFVFEDYPSAEYIASVDRALLSSLYTVVIDSVVAEIEMCDDSIIVKLLLKENCTVSGDAQFFEICPGEEVAVGDSLWSNAGTYTMHMISSALCDSIFELNILYHDSILIYSTVWVDADQDGQVSPGDTVLENIPVIITDLGDLTVYTLFSGDSIEFNSGVFSVQVDTALLPANFSPAIWSGIVDTSYCGIASIDFLVVFSCPEVVIIQNEILCAGDSIFIQGDWLTAPGLYSYLNSDPVTGCDTTLDVYVDTYPQLSADINASWNCESEGTIIVIPSGVPAYQYQWSDGMTSDSLAVHLTPGIYSVTITDGNGCSIVEEAEIEASPLLEFYLDDQYIVEQGDSVYIAITGDVNAPGLGFQWLPANIIDCDTCAATNAFPDSTTWITVSVLDEDSCQYFLETLVIVYSDTTEDGIVYIPNVFSPNQDGINDLFIITGNHDAIVMKELIIYDRWGELLFEEKNVLLNAFEGWNGNFRARPLNPGVFAYYASFILPGGDEFRKYGNVTLVR